MATNNENEAIPGTSSSCPFSQANKSTQKMNIFHILDETEDNEDSGNSSDSSSEVPDEEIEKMLEDALDTRKRKSPEMENEEKNYEENTKVVLIEKGQNYFDVLPEGWIQVFHNSGMPLYLHKTSRVCTMSRPYFLGPGSVRKHLIPTCSIPCLSYRKALEKEKTQAETIQTVSDANSNDNNLPNAKIETVQENMEKDNLTPEQLREYCESLFKFKTVKVLRFPSWAERRKYTKNHKQKQLQRPTLPDGTKLITFPICVDNSENKNCAKEWTMNPNGKSYVCILHEYVQHALKKQPTYLFSELENTATPYAATVVIKGLKYGTGYGASKKQAKSEAAKSTLEILIPEMRSKITIDDKSDGTVKKDKDQDLSFFDEIRVEDPRVTEFCTKTTEPVPYDILLTCLQRNFGLDELQISYQGNNNKHQGNEFTMTVGKHTVTVQCRNKKDGKQRAAQAILQKLHPSITSWGSMLRMYGNRSLKSLKEKKMEEQEITSLQSKAALNQPNYAILNKLFEELGKLKEKRNAIKPIGVLNTSNEDTPKLSTTNLKSVDL